MTDFDNVIKGVFLLLHFLQKWLIGIVMLTLIQDQVALKPVLQHCAHNKTMSCPKQLFLLNHDTVVVLALNFASSNSYM